MQHYTRQGVEAGVHRDDADVGVEQVGVDPLGMPGAGLEAGADQTGLVQGSLQVAADGLLEGGVFRVSADNGQIHMPGDSSKGGNGLQGGRRDEHRAQAGRGAGLVPVEAPDFRMLDPVVDDVNPVVKLRRVLLAQELGHRYRGVRDAHDLVIDAITHTIDGTDARLLQSPYFSQYHRSVYLLKED